MPPSGGNMTKTKLLAVVFSVAMFLSSGALIAPASAANEQVYVQSAPTATVMVVKPAVVRKPVEIQKPKPKFDCDHFLAKALYKAGFRKNGLRIAWAIAMRESGGRANAISSTGDYGVFQFNRAAHSKQPWWDTSKMLDRKYNIMIAFEITQGGKTFYPWDIDGKGRHKANYTSSGVYNKYKSWYNKYPEYCSK